MEAVAVSAADADTRRVIRARKKLQEAITQIERMEQRTATEGFLLMNMSAANVGDVAATARHTGRTVARILFAPVVEEADNASKS